MEEKTVIALGFFDGVHIGHGALLRKTVERARELEATPAAFTFDRAPKEFVTGIPVPLLTNVDERRTLIRERYGIERTIVEPFDERMMTMSARDFLDKLLIGRYHAAHLVAGHDYRFGYKNEGTPETLRAWCAERGIGCDIIPKVELQGVTVSSTHIRALVEGGDMETAAAFLGHPYSLTGVVKHGKHLGTEELFPTVNLAPEPWRVLPRFGVYAVRVVLPDGSAFPGVTNVGIRPTIVDDDRVTIETYLIDFDGDLYEKAITIEFLRYLRGEKKFDSMQDLHKQIERDIMNSKTAGAASDEA